MATLHAIRGLAQRHALVPAVVALTFLANSFPLDTNEGLNLWFGGIFPCIAILYVSPWKGVLSGVLAYLVTLLAWGHPHGLIGALLIALFAAMARTTATRKRFLDVLLWLSIAIPLLVLLANQLGGFTASGNLSAILKPPVNSILNVSLAVLLVETTGARRWLPGAATATLHPLRASLLAGFLAVSIVPLVLIFLLQSRHFEQNLRGEHEEKLKDAADSIDGELRWHLGKHLDAVISATLAIHQNPGQDHESLNRLLETWHNRFPGLLTMIVTDRHGRVIAAHPRTMADGKDYFAATHIVSDRTYFQEPKRNGKPHISRVFRGRGFGSDPIVAVSAAWYANGEFAGVVEGSLDLARMRDAAMELATAKDAELIILDGEKVIAASASTGLNHLDDLTGTALLGQIEEYARTRTPFRLHHRNASYLASATTAASGNWVVCLLRPESILLTSLNRYFTETTLLLSFIMVLGVIAANLLARQVTKPLDGLMQQVRRLRDEPGQYDTAAGPPADGPEEINILHRDFQEMTAQLRRTYRGLEQSIKERDGLNGRLTSLLSELEERVRQRTAEFENAKIRAEEASHTKSAFLANMSHEVRTPLNGVIGMLNMLLENPLESDQRKRALIALDSAEGLLRVLNDVLDLSKIEAGHMDIERLSFRMDEMVEAALLPARTTAESRHLSFQLTIDAKARGNFFGDPARLRQVLANLVGNAIKFTSHGSVAVIVRGLEIDERSRAIHVQVRDTGIGIAKSAQSKLFQPFQQADSTTTRKYGGTGLGLAICSELVRRMGGAIGFESEEGAGSNFWFRVVLDLAPVDAPAHTPIERPAEISRQRGCVLIVEDNTVNQLVARRLVEKAGFAATVVDSGQGALEQLAERSFDAILMDCQMPEMDGYQTTAVIRQREAGGGRTPIIAMTAHAMTGDRERCLEAGMDDYITKPVRETELQALLVRWTELSTMTRMR